MRLLLIFTITMLLGSCAGDQSKVSDGDNEELVTAHNQSADPEDKVICRREKVIGSNLTTKVCRTVKEMARERELAKDNMRREIDRMNRRTTTSGNSQ